MQVKRHHLIILLILAIASLVRFSQPANAPYWADVVSTLASATAIAHDGQMVWLGNPSAWSGLTAHSPLSIYFTAIPLFFFDAPIAAYIWYSSFGVVSVLVAYAAVAHYFGRNAGYIAALAIAVSPLAIYWSRFVWNPNGAPLFIIAWWWTALYGYQDDSDIGQVMHWVVLSIMIQMQAALAVLIPASGLLLCWHFLRTDKKTQTVANLAIGTVISITLAIPWFYGLYGESQGWLTVPFGNGDSKPSDFSFILPSLTEVHDRSMYVISGFRHTLRPLFYDSVTRAVWYPPRALDIVFYIHGLVVISGIGYFIWQGWRTRQKTLTIKYSFTVLAILTPLLFFFTSVNISYFYLQPITYFGAIILGVIMASLYKNRAIIAILTVSILLLSQLWVSVARLDLREDYATSIGDIEQYIQNWLQTTDDLVFLVGADETSTFIVREWGLNMMAFDEQYPIRVINEPQAIPISSTGSTVVGFADFPIITDLFGDGTLTNIPVDITMRDVVVSPDDLPGMTHVPRTDSDSTYSNLLAVDGLVIPPLQASDTSSDISVIVRWRPLDLPTQRYHFSLRLLDVEGNRLSQIDGLTLEADDWRVGDHVLTTFNLPIPSDSPERENWQFELIVYSFPDIETVPLSDGSGGALRLIPNASE